MHTDSVDRRLPKPSQPGPQQPEPENLPCPRCDSTNTKFCYYNNYNLSQPRHFCKSCRRYWTRGGTLRNIPVGGGSRKNSKRSRTATPAVDAIPATPVSASPAVKPEVPDVNDNGSFTSLLNNQGPAFLALGGFGLGLGSGLDDMGFGLGRGVWPSSEVGESGANGGTGTVASSGFNTWQLGSVDGGFNDGDCLAWPDLAISAPGKGLK